MKDYHIHNIKYGLKFESQFYSKIMRCQLS